MRNSGIPAAVVRSENKQQILLLLPKQGEQVLYMGETMGGAPGVGLKGWLRWLTHPL